jgi:acyl carrier protein
MSIEKEYYISISDDAFEKIEKIGFNVVYSNLTNQLKR